ncbi:MAG: tail fiber protein [Longimonas sp.]|uniref:phage tail protein n=1 Tax=Longimonas sp. TaxID=2039626 RepID=UPI0039752705
MLEPFIGQISMVGFNFAPRGWALCNGQLIAVSQNTALFSLLGTEFGGDGRTTFGLPDLRGRVPMHQGEGPGLSFRQLGAKGGVEEVTLNQLEMPTHNHTAMVKPRASSQIADESSPASHFPAVETTGRDQVDGYRSESDVEMGGTEITTAGAGGNQPHTNVQPYQVVNFVIALQGVYPSRS